MSEPLSQNNEQPGGDAHLKAGLPPHAPASVEQPIAYQPVSGWAVAGFGVSAFFTVLVAVSTVVALVQGAPFFLPAWILGFAVVGVVCSLIGQKQVKDSEGTRAGAKLARVGVWLSLVSGLSYLSYLYVTGLALQAQANAFVMEKADDSGFFPRLIAGASDPAQLNAAYLLTLPANQRSGRPDDAASMNQMHNLPAKDGTPGPLSQFRDNPLIRLFTSPYAKDAEITPLGVQDWKYEMRTYKIYRTYHVKTKELEIDVAVTVFSTEGDAVGKERKWFINMRESGPRYNTLTFKPLGNGIKLLRGLANLWLQVEVGKMNEGQPFKDIQNIDQTDWKQVYARDADRAALRKLIHARFSAAEPKRFPMFNVVAGREDFGKWEMHDGKVRIAVPFRAILKSTPIYQTDGYAVLQTRVPIDPAQFTELAAQLPEWDIISIVFTQVIPTPQPKM